jgi:hypothetical protein
VVKNWFNADGSLKPGAGALADPYGLELKQKGESAFRCERTRENILNQALYFACVHKKLDVAEFLLSQGADINAIVPGPGYRGDDSAPRGGHRGSAVSDHPVPARSRGKSRNT